MPIKLLMGAVSIAISVAAYGVYLWQTSRAGGIQPHPFSWLLWGLVTGVAYVVQVATGGGAGSWVSGLTSVMCIVIGLFSLSQHRWQFTLFDWLSAAAGLILLVSPRRPRKTNMWPESGCCSSTVCTWALSP